MGALTCLAIAPLSSSSHGLRHPPAPPCAGSCASSTSTWATLSPTRRTPSASLATTPPSAQTSKTLPTTHRSPTRARAPNAGGPASVPTYTAQHLTGTQHSRESCCCPKTQTQRWKPAGPTLTHPSTHPQPSTHACSTACTIRLVGFSAPAGMACPAHHAMYHQPASLLRFEIDPSPIAQPPLSDAPPG